MSRFLEDLREFLGVPKGGRIYTQEEIEKIQAIHQGKEEEKKRRSKNRNHLSEIRREKDNSERERKITDYLEWAENNSFSNQIPDYIQAYRNMGSSTTETPQTNIPRTEFEREIEKEIARRFQENLEIETPSNTSSSISSPPQENKRLLEILERREKDRLKEILERAREKKSQERNIQSPRIRLGDTYIKNLLENNERIDAREGIIYLKIEEDSDSRRIEEMGKISFLERVYIEKNKEAIERFRVKSLEYFSKEKKNIRVNIKNLERKRKNKLEDFILNCLIPFNEGNSPIEEKRPENPQQENYQTIIENRRVSILEETISEITNENRKSGRILSERINLEHLEREYKNKLERVIEESIQKSHIEEVSRLSSKENSINQNKKVPGKSKNLYFRKESETEYLIYQEMEEFILEHFGGYYLFNKGNIGTSLKKRNGALISENQGKFRTIGKEYIEFSEKMFILDSPQFKHPFVATNKSPRREICYGEANSQSYRRDKWGITQGEMVPQEEIARSMMETFRKAKGILTSSLIGLNKNTVYNSIESSGRKLSQEEFRKYKIKKVPIIR